MRELFVSYHFTAKNGKINGFGNYIGAFDEEAYTDDKRKFILDLEEAIANQVEKKISLQVQVKVLNFK